MNCQTKRGLLSKVICGARAWASLRCVLVFSFLPLVLICLFSIQGSARTITTNTNWSALSPVPDATEGMIIKNGATVTVDVGNAVANTVSMGAGGASAGAGTLKFNAGAVLTLSGTAGTLTLGLSATNSGTIDMTLVHGQLQKHVATGATSKTFEVGGPSNYTPVTVAFAGVSTAGDLTASVVSSDHAEIGSSFINPAKSVNRNWTLTNTGIVFTNYDATFSFVAGDVDSGANPSAFIVGKSSGGSWTHPTVGTRTSTSTQATGLTAFSDFQIGEGSSPEVSLLQSVMPSGTVAPGTDLVYSFVFTNNGSVSANSYTIIDPIPVHTDFKVSSATTGLGTTGLTITVEYSNDNAATWTYTPVSAGGGAAVDYDRSVTHVRWRFTGTLSQTSPNNTGSIGFTAKVQ